MTETVNDSATTNNNTEVDVDQNTQQTQVQETSENKQVEGEQSVNTKQDKTILTSKEIDKGYPESGYKEFALPKSVEMESNMLGKLTDLSKELNLSQGNAQKIVDLAVDHMNDLNNKISTSWEQAREGWVKAIQTDEKFGGANFNETVELAKRTLDRYGSLELSEFLRTTGFGDNNELIKMFAKIGKAEAEDKFVEGKPVNKSDLTAAQILYNKSKN